MKRYLLLILTISIAIFANSQTTDYNTALNIAENTIYERFSAFKSDTEYKISSYTNETFDNKNIIHVFNLEPSGFILISGDQSTSPVLAFSTESNYDINDKNPAVEFWVNSYKQQIDYNIKNNIKSDIKTQNEWLRLSVSPLVFTAKSSIKTVSPLLHTTWDQGRYYNAHCPEDNEGTDGRVVTGCVATALGQLMNYFRHPQVGTGSYGYNHDDYGWLEVNFSQQTYDYDYMPVKPTEYCDNMARLIYNIGVSVDMNYGPDGSGMWNHKGAYTLRTYFGYDETTEYLFKDSLPIDFDWNGTLVEHLNNNIPLYYAGWSDYDFIMGHAFLLDGYSDSTHYHINWGWGGSQNGYFVIDDLTPGGSDFTLLHEVIVNAIPVSPSTTCSNSKEINASQGIIGDGSGPTEYYQNDTECSWIILPQDSVSGIEFEVLKLLMDEDDYIVVYDGENDTDPVIETIYGNSTVETFESTSDKVLVKFVTDSDSVNDGWLISFNGIEPDYCKLIETITEPTAEITDGSNSYLYHNSTYCSWRIQPEETENIMVTLTEIDTEPIDDFIQILDFNNQLVATFSGNTVPEPLIVMGEQITIIFRSDNSTRHQGFSLYYEINKAGIDNKSTTNFNIYPNPVNDYLSISNINNIEITQIKIYTIEGKLIRTFSLSDLVNENQINCIDLNKGIYLIEINSSNEMLKSRFIKM